MAARPRTRFGVPGVPPCGRDPFHFRPVPNSTWAEYFEEFATVALNRGGLCALDKDTLVVKR